MDPWGVVPLGTEGFSVYALYEKGCSTPYYIGITRQDVDVRMEQHIKSGRYEANTTHRVLQPDLTIERARGYEQFYIEAIAQAHLFMAFTFLPRKSESLG